MIALILALVTVLGGFCGCGAIFTILTLFDFSGDDTKYITEKLEENGYTAVVYPDVSASKMKFTLTQDHIDEFCEMVDECEEVFRGGAIEDREKLERMLYETHSYLEFIGTQRDIAYLLFYRDFTDTQAREDHDFAFEAYTDASRKFYDFLWLRYEVSNKLTTTLKEYEETELDLVGVDDNFDDLKKERSAIVAEFDAMATHEGTEVQDELYDIYMRYVKNSYAYAKSYGYVNYYVMQNDGEEYTAEDKEKFREYVKKYLVPLCIEYRNGYKAFDETLSESEYNLSIALDEMDYRWFDSDLLYGYFDSIGGKTGATMKELFKGDKIVHEKGAGNGYGQAMSCVVGDTQIFYFPSTVVMEDAMYQSALYCNSMLHPNVSGELKGLYGYANMLLFMAYLDGKVDERARDSYAYYRTYEHLYKIISCTVKDEFDEKIFNNINYKELSVAEMERYMELLVEEYRALEYGGEKCVYQLMTYWSRRGVDDACQMFSSAVSMCAALDIYAEATVDYSAAAETYSFIMENIYSKRDFLGTMSRAGMYTPFAERFYIGVVNKLAWTEK